MLEERARLGLCGSRGRLREVGLGSLKVEFGIASGLSRGGGHTLTVRAEASLWFVDGWRL